ncbi:hypothetical protein ABK040_010981 [Willaertia magna]
MSSFFSTIFSNVSSSPVGNNKQISTSTLLTDNNPLTLTISDPNYQLTDFEKAIFLSDSKNRYISTETKESAKDLTLQFSSYLHHFANEPSIGLYRVSEHVKKKVPKIVEEKRKQVKLNKNIQQVIIDNCFAIDHCKQSNEKAKQLLQNSIVNLQNFLKKDLNNLKENKIENKINEKINEDIAIDPTVNNLQQEKIENYSPMNDQGNDFIPTIVTNNNNYNNKNNVEDNYLSTGEEEESNTELSNLEKFEKEIQEKDEAMNKILQNEEEQNLENLSVSTTLQNMSHRISNLTKEEGNEEMEGNEEKKTFSYQSIDDDEEEVVVPPWKVEILQKFTQKFIHLRDNGTLNSLNTPSSPSSARKRIEIIKKENFNEIKQKFENSDKQ